MEVPRAGVQGLSFIPIRIDRTFVLSGMLSITGERYGSTMQ